MDGELASPRYPGLGRQVGQVTEGLQVLGPAVGIAAVIHGIDPNEDVPGPHHLGPGHGVGEEDGIAARHIGDRDLSRRRPALLADRRVLGDGNVLGQSGAANLIEPHLQDQMPLGPIERRVVAGPLELDGLTLAIGKAQTITSIPLLPGHGQDGGRIKAAAQQDHGLGPLFIVHHSVIPSRLNGSGSPRPAGGPRSLAPGSLACCRYSGSGR